MLILISDISCPGGETPCNGNGQCNLKSGLCTCDDEHQGSDCSGKLILAMMMNFAKNAHFDFRYIMSWRRDTL